MQAVFAKNLPFMLDLAKSAPTPDQPSSHIGAKAADFVPASFLTSYGSPQTVEVNARRALGAVTVKWQIEGSSTIYSGPTTEFDGGERYGESGVYYHRMRGTVTGFKAGDKVKVWFEAGGKTADSFTFTASALGRGNQVLLLSAEDYSGLSPNTTPGTAPSFLSTYTDALADAGIPADVYDIDANGRNLADLHGVLGHYKAVIWYTGLDDFVRDPGQTVGISKMFDDQLIAVRDYLNEGGKVLVAGQRALDGAWSQYAYNPLGRFPRQAPVPFEHELGRRARGRSASSRTACRRPTTSCSTGWAPTPARRSPPARRRSAPRRSRARARSVGVLAHGPGVPAALHADLVGAVAAQLPAVRLGEGDAHHHHRHDDRRRRRLRPTTRCCGASASRTSPRVTRASRSCSRRCARSA